MLRVLEVLLFLAPFAAFALWRLSAVQGGPSPAVLSAAVAGLVILAVLLVWYALDSGAGSGRVYVPAQLQNGRVIPGHTAQP